jgi:predicted transcriptional regulator
MSEAVYAIEAVRLKVLAHLRKHDRATVDELSAALDIPTWAIEPALQSAELGGLALHDGHGVWALGARAVA